MNKQKTDDLNILICGLLALLIIVTALDIYQESKNPSLLGKIDRKLNFSKNKRKAKKLSKRIFG